MSEMNELDKEIEQAMAEDVQHEVVPQKISSDEVDISDEDLSRSYIKNPKEGEKTGELIFFRMFKRPGKWVEPAGMKKFWSGLKKADNTLCEEYIVETDKGEYNLPGFELLFKFKAARVFTKEQKGSSKGMRFNINHIQKGTATANYNYEIELPEFNKKVIGDKDNNGKPIIVDM